MDNTQVFLFLNQWEDKIPSEATYMLQESLKKLPADKASSLDTINLKSPIVGLILGLLLGGFGADRFYKGDIGLGVLKLLLCWATLGIWWIVDLFLVWKGIKQNNLNKINQAISFMK